MINGIIVTFIVPITVTIVREVPTIVSFIIGIATIIIIPPIGVGRGA
jgi:hypothetical protein